MSNEVAIIGGGLSGLTLALALHKQGIKCTVYEAHDAPLDTGGGLMLTPNGNKVLQGVGILESLIEHAFAFDNLYIQLGSTGAILETIYGGNIEKFGTRCYRAYRFTVLEQLLAKVHREGIPIHFNRRFAHVVRETNASITWQFTDGSTSSASILVGADGIHSTVREYVAPGIEPKFSGFIFLVAAVPTAQLGLPEQDFVNLNDKNNKHPFPSGIVSPPYGGIVMAPQTKVGDDTMISVMRPLPEEPDRWDNLNSDKERLRAMFRENVEKFPMVVQNALSNIPSEQLVIWPGYVVPLMERWSSVTGRAVVLGDAAHALPPSSGQGVNQAFEDVYLFAGVLGKLVDFGAERLQNALCGWQLFRQERVDVVLGLNKLMELRRLPAAAKAKQGITEHQDTSLARMQEYYDKLFMINYTEAIDECLRRGNVE